MSIGGVLIAVLGLCGTLTATWLTQRNADGVNRRELDHAEQQRRAEHEERTREMELSARRTAYIALDRQSRQYLTALRNRVHALELDPDSTQAVHELDEHRASYRDCYAEAQMIIPDSVLAVARQANQELNQTYGVLKRLQNGVPREGDSTASARDRIDNTRELLHELRHTMRCDLGVTEPSRSLPS